MADYNLQGDRLIQGKDCFVRAGTSPSDVKVIGWVSEYTIRVQVQTQKAEPIGHLLPASIDPTGVSVSTSFKSFVPKKGVEIDSTDWSAKNFAPPVDEIIDAEKVGKIPYLELYDKKNKCVVSSTTWAIATGYTETSSGKNYITADASFESIGFKHGSNWTTAEIYSQ